ncbi:hypothetical protein SCHPADRAFT_896342 [Schizopora paradoxa]|uniref:Uncharacterized protein n=1 Tax=Schizopora paradoxa TaxID=27342 RepID=A0A0H2R0M4_9AGAM|nr:hypothetical protein SCHPADRAFT_896342 [Schizopora paradoxa]
MPVCAGAWKTSCGGAARALDARSLLGVYCRRRHPPRALLEHPVELPRVFWLLDGCAGAGAGAVVGMAEVWYVGPIGRKIGEFGGDLSFELRSDHLPFSSMVEDQVYWAMKTIVR